MRDGGGVALPHVRAAVLLAAYVALAVAALPGVDLRPPPALLRPLAEVRAPVARLLAAAGAPLAIGQDWALFADGPGELRRLEVRVDDVAVYRTGDAAAAWSAAALANRHVRPALGEWLAGRPGATAAAAQAWLCERAGRAFPEAERVELVATYTPFLGAGRLGEPVVARQVRCRGEAQ